MKGAAHAGGVLELAKRWRSFCPWKGSTVAIWIPERRIPERNCSPRSASQFSCTVPDLPGTRSTQAGRGMILPSRQVHDASELTGTPSTSVLVMPHASHQPPAPEPPQKRAGSSDAPRKHGLIWDHTVFHVVASCRANPAMVAPSKRNCRIAQRIARTPKRARGAHIRSSCSRNITVWQVVSRHIQHRIVPPDPCQNPGPGCVDHLHHHAPVALCDSAHNQGTPPAGCTTQHQAPEYLGCEPRSSDGSPPNRRADHNYHTDQATHSSSR